MSKQSNFGQVIQAIVTDYNDQETFAQKSGITYRIITAEDHHFELGAVVKGFAYQNKKNEDVLLLDDCPLLRGEIVLAPVIEVKRQMGAFVDAGLPEKDLLVSVDLLPSLTHLWPTVDSSLYVHLSTDEQGQLWGLLAEREYFEEVMKPGSKKDHNANFSGRVVALHRQGTYVFTAERHLIFVHASERDEEPRLGTEVSGRIIGLREDGVLYGSFKPRAHEVIEEDAQMILATLKRSPNYKMSLHSKSKVQTIKDHFGISKARFKRGISHLYKERLIDYDETGTWLKEMKDSE